MPAPIDNSTMDRPHHEVDWKQEIHPPMRTGEFKYTNAQDIYGHVYYPPGYAHRHIVGHLVKFFPVWNILREPFFGLQPEREIVVVNVFGFPHHGEQVFGMMWAMWVFWGITIGVVHSMQDGICTRRQIGASLANPSKEIKESLPELIHNEHLMGCIPVKKEALAKQGEIPVQ